VFCEHCGEQIDSNALTCPKCGAAVASQVPQQQYQQPIYQQPQYQQYQQQQYQYQYQQPQYQQVFTNQTPQSDHSMFGWYAAVLKKYADFSGRARRKEYWMFYLCNFLISIIPTAIIYYYLFTDFFNNINYNTESAGYMPTVNLGALFYICIILLLVYGLAVFLPSIAVVVRRLHDIGKSGVWYFIAFVPYIGGIWLLVLMVTAGTVGPNQYGNDPKYYSGNSFPNYPNNF